MMAYGGVTFPLTIVSISDTQVTNLATRERPPGDAGGRSECGSRGRRLVTFALGRRRIVVDRIDDLIESFIQEHVSQTGTRNRISNLLRRDVVPHWGGKSIHELKKRDVSDLVSLVSQRNAHAGYRLLKTLKTFFRWCVGHAVIDFSPAEGLSSGYRENSRDRVLTDQELATIILAARQMPPPYGGIVELLALTGQRRHEVCELKWDELDEKSQTCSIPASRTKNKKAHIVHLSDAARKVIAQRPVASEAFSGVFELKARA
jgi:integrase